MTLNLEQLYKQNQERTGGIWEMKTSETTFKPYIEAKSGWVAEMPSSGRLPLIDATFIVNLVNSFDEMYRRLKAYEDAGGQLTVNGELATKELDSLRKKVKAAEELVEKGHDICCVNCKQKMNVSGLGTPTVSSYWRSSYKNKVS